MYIKANNLKQDIYLKGNKWKFSSIKFTICSRLFTSDFILVLCKNLDKRVKHCFDNSPLPPLSRNENHWLSE